MTETQAAVIEIIERRKKPENETLGNSIVVPHDVRINGQSIACSADDPVIVHEMAITGNDVVRVTLTLFAKRVFIGHEDIDANLGELATAQRELLDAQREAADQARASADRLLQAQRAVQEAQRSLAEGNQVADRLTKLGLLDNDGDAGTAVTA